MNEHTRRTHRACVRRCAENTDANVLDGLNTQLRPSLRGEYWQGPGSWWFRLAGESGGDLWVSASGLDGGLQRRVRVPTTLERFPHRLENQLLANRDAACGNMVVCPDNLAPGGACVPRRNKPSTRRADSIASWFTRRALHRDLQVHGETQTRGFSWRASCRRAAEAARIRQKTHHASIGLTARSGRRVRLM